MTYNLFDPNIIETDRLCDVALQWPLRHHEKIQCSYVTNQLKDKFFSMV